MYQTETFIYNIISEYYSIENYSWIGLHAYLVAVWENFLQICQDA
jgi:hypothetical protein